jgi:hypothetical protein
MKAFPMWVLIWSVCGCSSAFARLPAGAGPSIDRTQLKGQLFFTAVDSSEPPVKGYPLAEHLYTMPADGSRPPQRVGDFKNAGDLVVYPAQKQLGVLERSGDRRGSFVLDVSRDGNGGATQVLDATRQSLFTVKGWTPDPSSGPERRILPTQVVLSPDGRHLAGLDEGNHVCVAPVRSQEASVCAGEQLGCSAQFPTWSPDGKTVAFAGPVAGNLTSCNLHEVFLMDASTGATRSLTDIPGDRLTREMRHAIVKPGDRTDRWHQTGNPVWSPDGQWIAFSSRQGVGRIRADGSGFAIIAKGIRPSWSPDGTMVAYLAPRSDVSERARGESRLHVHLSVFVVRADGTGAVEIQPDPDSSLTLMDVAWTE